MEAQGAIQSIFISGDNTFTNPPRLHLLILNPGSDPPGTGGTNREKNGIWSAVVTGNTLRVSVV